MRTSIITFFFCLIIFKSKAQDLNWITVPYTTGSLSGTFNSTGNPATNVTLNITGYTAGLTSSYPVKYTANPDAGSGTTCASICALRSVPNFSDPANQSLILTFTFTPAISPLSFSIYDVDGNGSTRDSTRITASGPTGAQIITMINVNPGSSTIFGSGTTSAIAKGLNGNNNDAQTDVTITGFVSTLVVTFLGRSSFSIGNMHWSVALPVKWVSFSGLMRTNGSVDLNWITENEENVDHFEIERSKDGQNFFRIGDIKPKGSNRNSYNFADYNPGNGNTFYRIVEVDMDGRLKYTNVILIKQDKGSRRLLTVSPNPSSDYILLNTEGNVQLKKIEIFNNLGRKIYQSFSGNNHINISFVKAGIYLLRVEDNTGEVNSARFIRK